MPSHVIVRSSSQVSQAGMGGVLSNRSSARVPGRFLAHPTRPRHMAPSTGLSITPVTPDFPSTPHHLPRAWPYYSTTARNAPHSASLKRAACFYPCHCLPFSTAFKS